jgi:23S rRNA G2069 N7-methylase RlmK/C1962 C5-methylase RlmI
VDFQKKSIFMQDNKQELQAEMLANRLKKRGRHLSKWARRTGVCAYRLYDRDIPEIPLVLDYYEDSAEGAIAGALFQRPYEKDEEEEERWLDAMREAVAAAIGIDLCRVFIKRRLRQKGLSQYQKESEQGAKIIVNEGSLKFLVNLSDYLDTGLFLDRRLMRALLRQEAAGKKVLNLFCYTASFSVYAAAGGALETDSVDLSNTYLGWAKENFGLNRFKAELVSSRDFFAFPRRNANQLVRGDVLDFLKKAAAAKREWDLIVLDPPAFSNSKKMNTSLDLKRDYLELVSGCLSLLANGGKLWFSASAKRFNEDAAALEAALKPHFPNIMASEITDKTVDEDFRGRKTPKCFYMQTYSH